MRCDQQEGGVIRCLSSATFENAMSANKKCCKNVKLGWETEKLGRQK